MNDQRTNLEPVFEEYALHIKSRSSQFADSVGQHGKLRKTPRSSARNVPSGRSMISEDLTDITYMDVISDQSLSSERRDENESRRTPRRIIEQSPLLLLSYDHYSDHVDRINRSRLQWSPQQQQQTSSMLLLLSHNARPGHSEEQSPLPGQFMAQHWHDHDHNSSIRPRLLPPEVLMRFVNSQRRQQKRQQQLQRRVGEKRQHHNVTRLLRLDMNDLQREGDPGYYSPPRPASARSIETQVTARLQHAGDDNKALPQPSEHQRPHQQQHPISGRDERANEISSMEGRVMDRGPRSPSGKENDQDDEDRMSDAIIHDGYIIRSEGLTRIESSHEQQLSTREKYSKLDTGHEPKRTNIVTFEEYSKKAPVLPPDLLDDVRFDEQKTRKKFLSLKSITEQDWVHLQSIDMREEALHQQHRPQQHPQVHQKQQIEPQNQLIMVESPYRDQLTGRLLAGSVEQQMLASLRSMDDQIRSMDQIGSSIEGRFANTRKVVFDSDKSRSLFNVSKSKTGIHNSNQRMDRPLTLVDQPSVVEKGLMMMSRKEDVGQGDQEMEKPSQDNAPLSLKNVSQIPSDKEHPNAEISPRKERHRPIDPRETQVELSPRNAVEKKSGYQDNEEATGKLTQNQVTEGEETHDSTLRSVSHLAMTTSVNSIFTEDDRPPNQQRRQNPHDNEAGGDSDRRFTSQCQEKREHRSRMSASVDRLHRGGPRVSPRKASSARRATSSVPRIFLAHQKSRKDQQRRNLSLRTQEATRLAEQAIRESSLPQSTADSLQVHSAHPGLSPRQRTMRQILEERKQQARIAKITTTRTLSSTRPEFRQLQYMPYKAFVRTQHPELTKSHESQEGQSSPRKPDTYSDQLMALQPREGDKIHVFRETLTPRKQPTTARSSDTLNSSITNFSMPDDVRRIMYGEGYTDREDGVSENSNNVINWDEVVDMLQSASIRS